VPFSPATFAAAGRQHGTGLDPVQLVAALTAVRADALRAGWELIADPAELARWCERAGITVIGPGRSITATGIPGTETSRSRRAPRPLAAARARGPRPGREGSIALVVPCGAIGSVVGITSITNGTGSLKH